MIYKSFIKNILFAFVFLFLIIIVSFSGCISFCSLDSSEDKECVSYSEAVALCEEISTIPKGYPTCADFSKSSLDKMNLSSCESDFSSKIYPSPNYNNLTLNTEQLSNQFRTNILNAWKSADTIAFGYSEVNKTCDSFLNGDFVKYKKRIKIESENLDYYNKQTIASFLGLIYSTKKDLQDINVDLVQDTLLYKDYIELNAILNEFQKALGNNIQVKESLAKETIYFYTNYYGNDLSNKELSKAISSLSSSDADTETNADVVGWGATIGAVVGVGLINPPSAFIAALVKGFDLSNSISSKVSDFLENASQKTNLSEWRKLDILKNMLVGFNNAHGKYSYSDKAFFDLLNNIDIHIEDIKKENKKIQLDLITKTQKLKENLDSKIIEKSKFTILYEKYKIIESPYDLQSKLDSLQNKLTSIITSTIGTQHHLLLSYTLEYDNLKKQITNYMNSDYESLISLCTADFMNLKPKIQSLPESQDKTLLQNYINLFFSTKDDTKKLIYCANVISSYSDGNNYSCLSSLSNLISNVGLNYGAGDLTEKECETIIYSKLADAKETDKYSDLEKLFFKLNTELKILNKLSKYPICLSDKDYTNYKQKAEEFYLNTKYSDNSILNILMSQNYIELQSKLANYTTELFQSNNKGIQCVLENNYEYDLESKELIFNNPFGPRDLKLNLSLPNYGLLSIINNGCLINSKIKSDKIDLDFKCILNEMDYDITFKDLLIKTAIQKLTVDLSLGYLETKVCIPNQSKTNYLIDLPITSDKIISVIASKESINIPANILNDKLSLLFNNITNSETCVIVNYILKNPIITNIFLKNISEDNSYYIYNYDLNIKNELYLTIPKLKVLLDLPSNYDSKNVLLNSSNITNTIEKELPYVTINDIFGLVNLKYNYIVKISKDQNLDSELAAIYDQIISLKQYSVIPESKIKELLDELNKIKLISDTKTKLKEIQTLKSIISKLQDVAKENRLYINSYNLILQKIQTSISNYKLTIERLKTDYNISISEDIDLDIINSKLSEAEQQYQNGDVKEALKTLNTIKLNFKSIEDYISNIFDSYAKKTKDLQKQANKLDTFDNTKFNSIDRLGFDISQKLNSGDYLGALDSISEYDINQKDIVNVISKSIFNLKSGFKIIIDKYNNYKKNIDSLWFVYSLLDNQLNSEHYDSVKNFGISFSFTSTILTSIKNKITSITKDLIDLDKLSKENDSSDVPEIDTTKFDEFFYSFDSIDNSLELYQKEMRSKALNEITLAAGNSPSEIEFYKAKDFYDENNFVDAIYYAKISQLGSSKSQSNIDWTLYIGLGFIGLLVILVLVFGKRFSFGFGKGEKEIKKETYYTVEKEE